MTHIKAGDKVIDTDFYPKETRVTWRGTVKRVTKTHAFVQENIVPGFLVKYTSAEAKNYLVVDL